jgi:hypothetical protein
MSSISNQKQSATKPAIQTLILQASPRKWLGCIYLSNQEATGQLIAFLNAISGEYKGKFLSYPIYVIQASDKSVLEASLSNKLQAIISSNK